MAIYDALAKEISALNARGDVPDEVKFLIIGLLDYSERLEARIERLEKAADRTSTFI